MQTASKQRVHTITIRQKENILAEFAYQPAAEGKRHGGEVGNASKGEVPQVGGGSRGLCAPVGCLFILHIDL